MRLGLGLGLGTRKVLGHAQDPVLESWLARVGPANVSANTTAAAATFVDTIRAAGLIPKIVRLSLLCGNNLAACLVPLIPGIGPTTDTNVNFTAGRYVENSGLSGDYGSYLNTKTRFTKAGCIGGIFFQSRSLPTSNRSHIGTTDGSAVYHRIYHNGSVNKLEGRCGTDASKTSRHNTSGAWHAIRTSSTVNKLYNNGVLQDTNTTLDTSVTPNADLLVFTAAPGAACNVRMIGYGFDDGTMTDTEAAAYYAAFEAFNVALGR